MGLKPRERQSEAINKMVKFVNSKTTKKGLFVYPTSFGKSVVIANVASKFPDKYFINVTSSKELLKQNYQKFADYGYEAEICSASLGSKNVGKITFATIGTLIKQTEFFKEKEVVLLVDEAHVASKKKSQLGKFLEVVKNCKLIGTTATPLRLKQGMSGTELKMMNRDRDCIFSSIEDVVQISEVVEQNYWSKLIYDIKDVDEAKLQLNQSGTDYTDKSLKEFSEANSLPLRCIQEANQLISEGRKSILIFVPFIEDALEIERNLDVCRAVYSGMDSRDRDDIVNDFKSLKLKVVSQINILSYGFDHPELDAIIFARPTNSITIWYQGLGRGVRINNSKKDCKIIDLSGNFNKFGQIESINFENHKAFGGWAAFSGDKLLTNYPLGMENTPTRQSLLGRFEQKQTFENKKEVEVYFGKFKGRTVTEVLREKDGRQYLAWIVEPKTQFNFFGEKGQELKDEIYRQLRLPIPVIAPPKVERKEYIPTGNNYNTKDLVNNYTDNLKTIKDLDGIF